MQQCSLEAEEVKESFAFPGSAFHHDLTALPSCSFPTETAVSGYFGLLKCSLGSLFPSLLSGQSGAIIVADKRRAGVREEHFGSGWSSGKSWLCRVMEERAGGNVLQLGPALLWDRESGAHGGMLEGKGLINPRSQRRSGQKPNQAPATP